MIDPEPLYDFRTISQILPHRYPFCMVDAVLELEPGERILAIKNVSPNEPYFQGHFPEEPIMPGALMIESMAQTAVLLFSFSKQETEEDRKKTKFLGSVETRFLHPVLPGDRMVVELRVVRLLSSGLAVKGTIKVRGKTCMKGELLVMGKKMLAPEPLAVG